MVDKQEMKIYLAGGMATNWRDEVKTQAPKHEYYDSGVDTDQRYNFRIATQDFDGVDWADLTFANFERDNPSGIGLALEVSYAVAKGKRVVIVDNHDRIHGFLATCGERLYTDLETAISYLNEL